MKLLQGFKLRTADEYTRQRNKAESLPSAAQRAEERCKRKRKHASCTSTAQSTDGRTTKEQYMSSIGINTFEHAYDGIFWPSVVHVPRDLMHVELEGTLKAHLIGVLYMGMRKLKWFTLEQLNTALKEWPFPCGKRPDSLPEIPKGTKEGNPSPKATLRWTAGQMLHLVSVSVPLLGSLMSSVQRDHIVWRSWTSHVDYTS